jgi:hypothetical protein
MVVSPVSLTQEEVQPGARPKQPTLLGLGAAMDKPPPHSDGAELGPSRPPGAADVEERLASGPSARSSGRRAKSARPARSSPAAAGHPTDTNYSAAADGVPAEPTGFDALALHADVGTPGDIVSSVRLLADFALKLSLGPISRRWVPDVRRSVDALLQTGKHRNETALVALAARLLEVLSKPVREADAAVAAEAAAVAEPGAVSNAHLDCESSTAATAAASSGGADAGEGTSLDGGLREHILHELSRLAGVLPEWPAPAQDLAEEARRRETRVLRELLAQVDGLRRDQRARLEEQMRLEDLSAMSPDAIADEFDAPLERAGELRQVLDAYRQERQTRAPDVGNTVGLGHALAELEQRCQAFDACDPEQKDSLRVLRAQRRQALSAVHLLLAERGELDWLEQLEPLAIGERVDRLKQWLDADSEKAS